MSNDVSHLGKGDTPVHQKLYWLANTYREAVERENEIMLTEGVIEHCSSEWASPIVVVRKKDNTIRLSVDYRKLNAETLMDAYLMLQVDEILDQLEQARYLSTLNLVRGYWQVTVAEEDHPKITFITLQGLYQFCVMSFGLCGAPVTFNT